MHEHELLSRAVEAFGVQDLLNLMQLNGIEILVQRLQLLEEAVAISPEDPSFENSDAIMGYGEKRGGALTATSLRKHTADQVSRETALLKEQRKAKEAKAAKGAAGTTDHLCCRRVALDLLAFGSLLRGGPSSLLLSTFNYRGLLWLAVDHRFRF